MKIKKNTLEQIVYYILCICSFGTVAIIRLMITIAIRYAFEEK